MTGFVDPYIDPEIGELRNLLGARSSDELKRLEPQAVFANELELPESGIPHSCDFDELCAIHGQLFSGVYDWAGQIRTVDIKKGHAGAEFFLPVTYIRRAAAFVFDELCADGNLTGLRRDEFVKRLAYYYDQLNYIHTFREGNGRTQRVFWTRIANSAGYDLAWEEVVGSENDEACRTAMEKSDLGPLEAMFDRITG
ncbi:MAG: Fic family protein, partial [Micrococcales bacterium]|nr:Fic family protein [Micrococcales bacterium]